MPIFFDPLVVFLHIPKNAGRSIEDVFLPKHENRDWGRPNRLNSGARLLLNLTRSEMAYKHLIGTQDIIVAAQHLTYMEMELLGLLPQEQPRAILCVCRNPYDRAVSSVAHFKGKQTCAKEFEYALDEWLDQPLDDHNLIAHRRTQKAFIVNSHNEIAATHVLRFEALQSDFYVFAQSLGLDHTDLPWRGKAMRDMPAREFYTPRARAMVEREFAEDLDHFGYVFP
jgi:hypothetical protein